jgi:hypothetical protein
MPELPATAARMARNHSEKGPAFMAACSRVGYAGAWKANLQLTIS